MHCVTAWIVTVIFCKGMGKNWSFCMIGHLGFFMYAGCNIYTSSNICTTVSKYQYVFTKVQQEDHLPTKVYFAAAMTAFLI